MTLSGGGCMRQKGTAENGQRRRPLARSDNPARRSQRKEAP